MFPTQIFCAKQQLHQNGATFVFVGRSKTFTDNGHGIGTLLTLHERHKDFSDGVIADKFVGKAAAMLMLACGARIIYAETLSVPALRFLKRHGAEVSFTHLVPQILNRQQDGFCPMEQTVLDTDDTDTGVRQLKKAYAILTKHTY